MENPIPHYLRQLLANQTAKNHISDVNTHVSKVNAAFTVPHERKTIIRYLEIERTAFEYFHQFSQNISIKLMHYP